MFEDSLVESSGRLSTRRPVTTLLSFGLQIFLIGILILIPLIYTEALPKQQLMTFLVAPPPPPPPPPPAQVIKVQKIETELDSGVLRQPTKIPEKVKILKEEEQPAQTTAGILGGVPGGVPGGAAGGVIGGIIGSTQMPRVAAPQRVRVSQGVTEGLLTRKVQPAYPPLAKTARIQGDVVLNALISKNGNIENLRVMSGHPMLVTSALDAVKQWKYKPYILNGEPVEVETTITVKFTLAGG
jgi:protein TonB